MESVARSLQKAAGSDWGARGQELRTTPLEGSLSFQLSPRGALASWPQRAGSPRCPAVSRAVPVSSPHNLGLLSCAQMVSFRGQHSGPSLAHLEPRW